MKKLLILALCSMGLTYPMEHNPLAMRRAKILWRQVYPDLPLNDSNGSLQDSPAVGTKKRVRFAPMVHCKLYHIETPES